MGRTREYPLDPVSTDGIVFSVLLHDSTLPRRVSPLLTVAACAAFLAFLWTVRWSTTQSAAPSQIAIPRSATSARDPWTGGPHPAASTKSPVDLDALTRELIDRGKAALADGDFESGFKAYRRAVEYNPNAETHGLIGDLYLHSAAISEAAFHLRRAADLEPNNPDRWLALANVYILETDLGAAWKAIDRAKEVEPNLIVERDKNNFVVRGHAG